MNYYDVVIIGAGIHGAGVAQASVLAGYKTLVLEKTAVASGTSGRSSKLIHGGLRYLETGQFRLVLKALREREILLTIAPHLVKKVPFYIPIYKDTSRKSWLISLGLCVYQLLGGGPYLKVPRNDWSSLDGLNLKDLKAIFQYWDAQTDDVLLTGAVLKSAMEHGAEYFCPARFLECTYQTGVFTIRYGSGGKELTCRSKCLVNATGPWINETLKRVHPSPPLCNIELIQGTHIILDHPAPDACYYVESPTDKRAVFMTPWKGRLMVGTTEHLYEGDLDSVRPREDEIQYLYDIFTHYHPQATDRIVDSFSGLRVLAKQAGDAFGRPRDVLLLTASQLPGLVSIVGGKLTAYRSTAEQVMDTLSPYLPLSKSHLSSKDIRLP